MFHSAGKRDLLQAMAVWRLKGIRGRVPPHLPSRQQPLANREAARCSTYAGKTARPRGYATGYGLSGEGSRQDIWRQFSPDPTLKKASRSPDFRHTASQEVLRLNSVYKRPWMDAQLGAPGMQDRRRDRPARCESGVTAETVSKLCHKGVLTEAVEALESLVRTDCRISKSLFYALLRKCVVKKDLRLGRRVHSLAVRKGYESDTFLCNHILRMYASHARLQEAMDVFDMVAEPDAFMWSSIISSHVKHGKDKQAIELYHRMRRSGVKPDAHVFVAALQACAKGTDLISGQQVHADVLASRIGPNLFVSSCLVDMYAKCGSLEDAQRVFDGISQKDVVTWSAMIAGYSQRGMGLEALRLYRAMQDEGVVTPDSVTFVCVLQACARVGSSALEQGKQIHSQIGERGLQGNVVVCCSLIDMYAKCGSLEEAQKIFDGLRKKDIVTWNAMIAGYSQQGQGQKSLALYRAMQEEGVAAPDPVTFVCLLQACASVGPQALEEGRQLHAQIRERGHQAEVFVANSLVNMYAKCGSLEDAQGVFETLGQKTVVTWNALIAGYSQQGMGQEALRLYACMREGTAVPTSVTFLCLLQACASVGTLALVTGREIHAQLRKQGLQADVSVSNSLVNMYAKCGSLEEALGVFDRLSEKNVVTWTALIAGYSQQGMGQEALRLYLAMQEEGLVAPDCVTFVFLLQACSNVAALHLGKQLHAQIKEQGLLADVFLASSLINMYSKSGSMDDAQEVFDGLPNRDIVTWSALIAGYASQGQSEKVFDLVQRMRENGIQPDSITFLSVLTVCSHKGLVNQGQEYFQTMSQCPSVSATVEHYTCMVDLLGRAGRVDDALALVRSMPLQADAAVWSALLGACQKWNNVKVGRCAFDEAVKLDKKDAAAYMLMSNIYAGAEMWEQARDMQVRRKENGAWKQPGQSWWTDMGGRVHSFLVRAGQTGAVWE